MTVMHASLHRYWALTVKELHQLRRNRPLLVQLLIPPTVVLVIFGFALNLEVRHLRTGVVDESGTPESRELLSALTESRPFEITARYRSSSAAAEAIERRELDLAVIVPGDYAESRRRGRTAQVQIIIDAVNANTAMVARGYLARAIADHNGRAHISEIPKSLPPDLNTTAIVLYNPGLSYAWFAVTGVMSLLIFINGALVASAVTVREKEFGTIDQLLIGPARTLELLLAKTTPVVVVLVVDLLLALLVARLVFDLPVRGSLGLLVAAGVLAGLAGTGIGTTLATFASTQQQAQLLTFFLLPPLVLLSGAFTPIAGMPVWLQYVSAANPLPYLLTIVRGITLKSAGMTLLWSDFVWLGAFSVVLYGVSVWRFRKQLGW